MKRTALERNTKPIRRNSPLKRSANALKRSRVKSKPTKRRPEDVNEGFLNWLRDTWPYFVCFKEHWGPLCGCLGQVFEDVCAEPDTRYDFILQFTECGPTEAAHVGVKGTGKRCPDREAMPLGRGHHRDPLDGGRPDSHHAGTKTFWTKHGLDRNEVFTLLHRLYTEETGKEV